MGLCVSLRGKLTTGVGIPSRQICIKPAVGATVAGHDLQLTGDLLLPAMRTARSVIQRVILGPTPTTGPPPTSKLFSCGDHPGYVRGSHPPPHRSPAPAQRWRTGRRAADLLSGRTHNIEIHIQLTLPEQFCRPEEDHKTGAVIHGQQGLLPLAEGRRRPGTPWVSRRRRPLASSCPCPRYPHTAQRLAWSACSPPPSARGAAESSPRPSAADL